MSGSRTLLWLALAGAVVPTAALIVLTLMQTGGTWEYALDDVYIHLAMSEAVARGEYGVNVGEAASASSSILYSYLLAPFANAAWHPYWPLVLGLVGLVAAAILWARALGTVVPDYTAPWGVALAALALFGPVWMHFPALSLIGMEHMLHVCAALMVALGLIRVIEQGEVGWMLVLGIVLNPLLRFEGMALAVFALAVLMANGRVGTALGLGLLTAIPLGAHFWHMSALGLDMLPNSVNAKAAVVGGGADVIAGAEENNRLRTVLYSWGLAISSPSGRLLAGVVALGTLGLLVLRRHLTAGQRALGWSAVLVALAHVTLGSVAPFYRYELYVFAYGGAVAVYLLGQVPARSGRGQQFKAMLVLLAFGVGGVHYPITAFEKVPGGGAAIHAQQRQMGLFVDRYWQAPVAVNDLGHVAYRNPHYVLDLWGLASAEALAARSSRADPLWAEKLARRYDVGAAMIYRHWLAAHIPDSWIAVATLELTIPRATLGGNIVTIYATGPETVAPLTQKLRQFAPELPPSAVLKFNEITDG